VTTGTANDSRLLFTLLLNLHSPKRFRSNWERRFLRSYSSSLLRERYRDEFLVSHPTSHRYNDIAGFAELYWDGGTRILVQYYLRGLKRRKFTDTVTAHWGSNVFGSGFYSIPYCEVGGVPHRTCSGDLKRRAILDAMERVQSTADDWGCYLELTNEKRLLNALDIDLWLSE